MTFRFPERCNVFKQRGADPTFGCKPFISATTEIYNRIAGAYEHCPERGVAESITVGLSATKSGATGKVKCAIYRKSDNMLVGVTEEKTVTLEKPFPTAYLLTFNFLDPKPTLEATDYALVAWSDSMSLQQVLGPECHTNAVRVQQDLAYNSFPDSWSPITLQTKEEPAIYCTYTAAPKVVVLEILSSPITGVPLTIDGISGTTPFSTEIEVGTYTITVADRVTVDDVNYWFVGWVDGVPDRTRTIELTESTTLTANYATERRFGYETKEFTDIWITNRITGSWFTCPDSGIAQSITAAVRNALGVDVPYKCAIYRRSDGKLIGVTEEVMVPPTGAPGPWITFNFPEPKPQLEANTDYYLVAWAKQSYSALHGTEEVGKGGYQELTYNSFPDPWSRLLEDRKHSIYCTYVPAPPRIEHTVAIESAPVTGVPVTVDETSVGNTPTSVSVVEGEHTVSVPKEVET